MKSKLTKAQSSPSLFQLLNNQNGFITLSLDENIIQPPDEKNDSPLLETTKKDSNKATNDDNQSFNLTLTLDPLMEKHPKSHKKAPKLSFDPPPITNDDDMTIPDEFSREDIKNAFFNMHKNEITTPEEFDEFVRKIKKNKLSKRKVRE